MNLQKLLAENMLRFGSKNLDSKAKRTLNRLVEQGNAIASTKLASIAPGVDVWLDSIFKQKTVAGQVWIQPVGNFIACYQVANEATGGESFLTTGGEVGAGTLRVYTLDATNGWPMVVHVCTLMNSLGPKWRTAAQPELYRMNKTFPSLVDIKVPTGYTGAKFNEYWANLPAHAPVQEWDGNNVAFKNSCVTVTQARQAEFQEKFKEKNYYPVPGKGNAFYKDQTSNQGSYKNSIYYMQIDEPIKDPIARKIYEIIKDPETITKLSTPPAQ